MGSTFSRNNAASWIISQIVSGEDLVNESPIRNPVRLYLWGANCLSATAIRNSTTYYDLYKTQYDKLIRKVKAVKDKYGLRCRTPYAPLFHTKVRDLIQPTTSFQHSKDYQIPNTNYYYANYDKTDGYTKDTPHASIQLLRAIYYYKKGDIATAKYHWNNALGWWDGSGFADEAFTTGGIGHYEFFQYALYKIAKNITHFSGITPPCALAAMQQNPDGSVFTHYKQVTIDAYKANPSATMTRTSAANTECTPLALMAGFSSTSI